MTATPEYLEALTATIAKAGTMEMDHMMGTISRTTNGICTYATPGWEGEALPFHCSDEDGNLIHSGTMPVVWTGDIEQDLETFSAAMDCIEFAVKLAIK